jgi:hypothetical protein
MRRCVTLGLLLVFIGATMALAGEPSNTPLTKNNIVLPAMGGKQPAKANHTDEVIFFEDWESGLNGWVSRDLTATPGTWHIDTWNAFGGTGMSWCMGQHPVYCDTVGYDNAWYMVLDSPPIVLPAAPCSLTFWHRVACEIPGGEPAGYNGWDGCNIRISTNEGASWTVIPNANIDPDYDRSSLYSFGFQHGEGTGVPGWVGNGHLNWFYETADLSTWAGQTVRLRWAFASDPGWSTCTDATSRWAFGWQVDNIRVFAGTDTIFSNNGDSDTGWYSHSNKPIGGDLWRVADECNPPPCPPPSGSHYLACNDSVTFSYSDNMDDELVSPYIDLRGLSFGTLEADFQITGSLGSDPDNFPDCDFWHWEVTQDSGATWWYESLPCGNGLYSYVFPDAPPDWYLFSTAYGTGMFDMTCYIGSVVRIKAVMESNGDGLTGVGPCFDDFALTYSAGYPNDMSCYSLQVRFPTTAARPAYATAYFVNAGSVDQSGVPAWWTEEGGTDHRLIPNLALASNQTATRSFTWTPAAAGMTTVWAWSALDVDEYLGNDTSYCQNIDVRDAGTDLELGYDNRATQWRFNYDTGNGALVKFTPAADSIDLPFNVNAIRMLFAAEQSGTKQIGLRILRDAGGMPGEGVFWGTVTVTPPGGVLPNWKEVIVDGQPGVHGMDGDFWVWLEVLDTSTDQRFPQILGHDAEDWLDQSHYYTYRRGDTLTPQPYYYMVRALVAEGTSGSEVHELAPLTYSLSQNYPNPFNPVTEISYSIPQTGKVSLRVFNLLGQEVAVLVDGTKPAGAYKVSFDGSQLPSGIYMYRLETDGYTMSKKMVLMK